ncbi:coproporphyrinogen III oxidase family protein [Collinsella sp. BA40]|uniref:coproporphyrinogen III oxidase family protein n=1 Tax=Collinsella sp. BA40 TaxID=2560852 RepID=UPI0011CA1EF2|nr:coproporphyrinogen III oxidase family protein [Collinsella sp. BA40]TXF38620.1 coproporphyrinogen III oxidase family protein [Collinsella sp. BA40]
MLSERLLSATVGAGARKLLRSTNAPGTLPAPNPGHAHLLYVHIPFCDVLCPYCSFTRFPLREDAARRYFQALHRELAMIRDLGYQPPAAYIGGGTPTILMDELERTIDYMRELFPSIREVSCETNPPHLDRTRLERLSAMVQRLSVGVQSFDNTLLKRMDRYGKNGSAEQIVERIQNTHDMFGTFNVDMIFNFPGQTEEMVLRDIETFRTTGANQITYYPLMTSPGSERLMETCFHGKVDPAREQRLYHAIFDAMTADTAAGGAGFHASDVYTFAQDKQAMIDEYVVDYGEYVAAGCGGYSFLGDQIFANDSSLAGYCRRVGEHATSVTARIDMGPANEKRYRMGRELFGLRLDNRAWKRDFGRYIQYDLPMEYGYLAANGAFATNNADELTLTRKGRYLVLAMMRQVFIGMNTERDRLRAMLPPCERKMFDDSAAQQIAAARAADEAGRA